jgi:hypothetical protein
MSKHTLSQSKHDNIGNVTGYIDGRIDTDIYRVYIQSAEIQEANPHIITSTPELICVAKEIQELQASYWYEHDVRKGILDRTNSAIDQST